MASSDLPRLPSVLPASPALRDVSTTAHDIAASLARVTNPAATPIFICALKDCNRLFPSRDRLMLHRRRDHDSDHAADIITWNDS